MKKAIAALSRDNEQKTASLAAAEAEVDGLRLELQAAQSDKVADGDNQSHERGVWQQARQLEIQGHLDEVNELQEKLAQAEAAHAAELASMRESLRRLEHRRAEAEAETDELREMHGWSQQQVRECEAELRRQKQELNSARQGAQDAQRKTQARLEAGLRLQRETDEQELAALQARTHRVQQQLAASEQEREEAANALQAQLWPALVEYGQLLGVDVGAEPSAQPAATPSARKAAPVVQTRVELEITCSDLGPAGNDSPACNPVVCVFLVDRESSSLRLCGHTEWVKDSTSVCFDSSVAVQATTDPDLRVKLCVYNVEGDLHNRSLIGFVTVPMKTLVQYAEQGQPLERQLTPAMKDDVKGSGQPDSEECGTVTLKCSLLPGM